VNLRPASQSQNTWNKKIHSNNRSGFKGISWHKRNRVWNASIWVNGKTVHLGTFDTPERAWVAYVVAARKHFGIFARVGAGGLLRGLKPGGRIFLIP
jgi:AP2 domain